MNLRRFFASFSIVLLLFSVSVPLCFANTIGTSAADYALTLYISTPTIDPAFSSAPIAVPSGEVRGFYSFNTSQTYVDYFINVDSNVFEYKPYDRTLIFTVGVEAESGTSGMAHFSGVSHPNVILECNVCDQYDLQSIPGLVSQAGYVYQNLTSHGEVLALKVIIPAYVQKFYFKTEDNYWFWWDSPGSYRMSSYGAYIIDSSDDAVVNAVLQILQHTQSIDNNTGTMVVAINQILSELRALNADTDTIVTLLNSLTSLSQSQLNFLEDISGSVDAIYAFLVDALSDESDEANESVQSAVDTLDQSARDEATWQEFMSTKYDDLDLENFNFGSVTGGIELVGTIFTRMWNAFGEYQILFTFPLVLAIATLVVGRMSKFGGGNSSRQREHKGGEGGA